MSELEAALQEAGKCEGIEQEIANANARLVDLQATLPDCWIVSSGLSSRLIQLLIVSYRTRKQCKQLGPRHDCSALLRVCDVHGIRACYDDECVCCDDERACDNERACLHHTMIMEGQVATMKGHAHAMMVRGHTVTMGGYAHAVMTRRHAVTMRGHAMCLLTMVRPPPVS